MQYCLIMALQAGAGTSFKAAKALQQRDSAGNRAAWNALFMRPDTVAQAIAAHYNVSKADLLHRDASGAARSVNIAYMNTPAHLAQLHS